MWQYWRVSRNQWVCNCGLNVANEIQEAAYADYSKGKRLVLVEVKCPHCGARLELEVYWTSPSIHSVRLATVTYRTEES